MQIDTTVGRLKDSHCQREGDMLRSSGRGREGLPEYCPQFSVYQSSQIPYAPVHDIVMKRDEAASWHVAD